MLAWALDESLRDGAGSVHLEDVLKALGQTTPLVIAMDGKHLRGTRRGRKGEEALVFLSALIQGLGLSLGSLPVEGSEGQTTQVALVRMEGLAVDWVMTTDAGLTSQALAKAVVASKKLPPGGQG